MSISSYLSSIPRNTSASIQRLTPYGWLRLFIIVAMYLLIRPWLMKLAERGQVRAHDQVLGRVGGSGRAGEEDEEQAGDRRGRNRGNGETTGSDRGVVEGGKGRKRTVRGVAEVEMQGGGEGEEEDDDEAFLRKYCGVRAL